MGLFDFFTGTKRPKSGISPKSDHAVAGTILALNRDSAPFTTQPDPSDSADFIAEWKIVDAKWYEIFAKAGLTRVFRIRMKLDPVKNEVRAVDEEFELSWSAGVPTLKAAASGFRGQKTEMSFGTAYAFTETLAPGQVYKYRFDTKEIKTPLQEAVTDCGWTWRGVSFGKL